MNQCASCQICKIAGAHAPGMPGTFSPSTQVSDPDMHHGTCVTHVPWCMPGSLTSSFLWNRRRGKTFPAFPAHAQPAILRIWQEAHDDTVYWHICSLTRPQLINPTKPKNDEYMTLMRKITFGPRFGLLPPDSKSLSEPMLPIEISLCGITGAQWVKLINYQSNCTGAHSKIKS